MRRIGLPLGRGLVVALAVPAMLAVTLPARIAAGWLGLDALGLSARTIQGAVWSARATEARVGGLPLGDLAVGLHPLPLLAGRARIGFSGAADGVLTVARHLTALDAARLRLETGARLAPLPVRAIVLDGVRATFRDDLCDRAEGSARLELAGDPALGLPASLAAPLRCEAGALLLPFAAPGGERLTVRLTRDRLHAELALPASSAPARTALQAAGFAPAAGGALAFDAAW